VNFTALEEVEQDLLDLVLSVWRMSCSSELDVDVSFFFLTIGRSAA
jgi:hypothetical protein